jgi:hypothetical protein
LAAIREGGVRGRIDGGNGVAHALELLGYRGQFSGVDVAQGLDEPGGQAGTRALDDRIELAQPRSAGAVAELGGGLQTDHFHRELPISCQN